MANPNLSEAYRKRGVAFFKMGNNGDNYNRAINDYKKTLELNPLDAKAYSNLRVLHSRLGNIPLALSYFDQAIKTDPLLSWPYQGKASALVKKKRYDEAISTLTELIELEPDNPVTHFQRGYVFSQSGNYNEAIVNYEKALELNPNYR